MKKVILFLFLLTIEFNANSQSCYYAINIEPNDHPTYNWINSYTITGCYNTTVNLVATGNYLCSTSYRPVYWYDTVPNATGSNYFSYTQGIGVPLNGKTIYMRTSQTSSTGQAYVVLSVSGYPDNRQPIITGTTSLCNNIIRSTYTGATDWSLSPSNAGTLVYNNNSTCTITWVNNYVGTVQLTGRNNAPSSYCGYTPYSAPLNITLNPIPSIPIITQNANILHSSSLLGNQWYNQNGIINGAINQDYTPTISGNYYVTNTASGCSSTSAVFNYTFLATDEFILNNDLKIYPNPTNSKINIDFGNEFKFIGSQVKLSNVLGQDIFDSKINQQIIVIPLSSIATRGLYFVSIVNSENKVIATKKIILN